MTTTTANLPKPDVALKTKPVYEVRLGSIKAAVWRKETEVGARYNVTFARLYKDGDQWKSTESFGCDDLLVLGKVADQAHSWICMQGQEEIATARSNVPKAKA